jgi:hypothetical protein
MFSLSNLSICYQIKVYLIKSNSMTQPAIFINGSLGQSLVFNRSKNLSTFSFFEEDDPISHC